MKKKKENVSHETSGMCEICHINFSKNGKSSMSYMDNGRLVSIFIDGVYHGEVEVCYKDKLTSRSIISIKQL